MRAWWWLLLTGCTQFSFEAQDPPDPGPDDGRNPDTAPPEAICGVQPDPAAPLAPVTWLGENSYDPDGNPLVAWRWTLVARPEGSSATLPGGAANIEGFIPDLAGDYTATLIVTDDYGNPSEPCATTLTAAPQQGLYVELVWEFGGEDLDLYAIPADSSDESDACSAAGCATDWASPGDPSDDPTMLQTDIDGTGPEVLTIERPDEDVEIVLGAVDRAPPFRSADNVATMRVWLAGQLAWEGTKTFSDELQNKPFLRINPVTADKTEL